MRTSLVRLMLFCWLLLAYDLRGEPAASTGKLLVQFAALLHSEANATVLVRTSPDNSCLKEPISPFESIPQVVWNERIHVTFLRYWGDHVCVETYVESDSGAVSFSSNSYQTAMGTVTGATKYNNDKSLAFLIRSSSDWEKLLLSVPRFASLKAVESMTSRSGDLRASARRFREHAAEILGDSRADPPRNQEVVHKPDASPFSKLPVVVYIMFLVLLLSACAVGFSWGKKNRYRRGVEGNDKQGPVAVPEAPRELSGDSLEETEAGKDASFSEAIAAFKHENVSDAYIEVVTKSARVLFVELEKNRDPGSLRKVRHYLAEKMTEWREKHPDQN